MVSPIQVYVQSPVGRTVAMAGLGGWDMAGSRHSLRVVPPESFGSRLRAQRQADNLTQAELAPRFGVRQQTLGAWERGERPQSRFFRDLGNYLGLGERELVSLLGSQAEMLTGQDAVGMGEDESADSDAATVRMLARQFIDDQRTDPLPPEQAAEIYKNFIGYFRARSWGPRTPNQPNPER